MIVSVLHLKAVLQLEGSGRLVTLQPPGGVRGLSARGGDRAEEDAGVCSSGESGRKRLWSRHPHLHLLQPALLQPHGQGVSPLDQRQSDIFRSSEVFIDHID